MAAQKARMQVSPQELRRYFNNGRFWERARSGEFIEKLDSEGHPSPKQWGEPPCTRSQIIAYLDSTGHRVAVVHQYLRKDGTLGGSGKPDPKKLYYRGVLYAVRT